jgi:hypothetical protein
MDKDEHQPVQAHLRRARRPDQDIDKPFAGFNHKKQVRSQRPTSRPCWGPSCTTIPGREQRGKTGTSSLWAVRADWAGTHALLSEGS